MGAVDITVVPHRRHHTSSGLSLLVMAGCILPHTGTIVPSFLRSRVHVRFISYVRYSMHYGMRHEAARIRLPQNINGKPVHLIYRVVVHSTMMTIGRHSYSSSSTSKDGARADPEIASCTRLYSYAYTACRLAFETRESDRGTLEFERACTKNVRSRYAGTPCGGSPTHAEEQ